MAAAWLAAWCGGGVAGAVVKLPLGEGEGAAGTGRVWRSARVLDMVVAVGGRMRLGGRLGGRPGGG